MNTMTNLISFSDNKNTTCNKLLFQITVMSIYPILSFRASWIYPIFGFGLLIFCWFLPYVVVSAAGILSKSASPDLQSTAQVKEFNRLPLIFRFGEMSSPLVITEIEFPQIRLFNKLIFVKREYFLGRISVKEIGLRSTPFSK